MRSKNSEGYNTLEAFTMAALEGNLVRTGMTDEDARTEIRRMTENQADLNGWYDEQGGERTYSERHVELAREEVVANTVLVILTDEVQARRFVDRVMQASEDVRSWFERLINKLFEVLNKAYKQLSQDKSWAQMELVRKDRDAIQMIADAYFEGMAGARGEERADLEHQE